MAKGGILKANAFGASGKVHKVSDHEWSASPEGCKLVGVDACGLGLPGRLFDVWRGSRKVRHRLGDFWR